MANKTFKAEDLLTVTNRSSHSVSYPVPESDGTRWRDFEPGTSKKLTYGELEQAIQQSGCALLFAKYLMITDPNAAEEIMNKKQEPEYFMTSEQVKKWLPTCSLNELLDALDFAPDGVLSLIKQYAVELPLTDMNKAEAIKEKLGFDVMRAIQLDKESKATEEAKQEEKKERRVTIAAPAGQAGRRVVVTAPENK